MNDNGDAAERFAELFRGVYLTFHRRDGKRNKLSGASSAVLGHLALSGPLTVGEAAAHLDRAQSVISEIVDGLARRGLLEREHDPADRRRTLVWLTDDGRAAVQRDRQVLDVRLVARALDTMSAPDRDALFRGLRALTSAPTAEADDSRPLSPGFR